ncbi:hypothetical protein QE152_g40983 [Popillia japonica]|uniref:Uncharacterized protein n=1 Tax=Popillia japonica TaxID=7064 RepID=A0AAW1HET4_POPJA
MTYKLTENMKFNHAFSKFEENAGLPWLHSFLRRNSEQAVLKAEGFSRHRMLGMNKVAVNSYFHLLHEIMKEHDLCNKLASIYNVNEIGLQLNVKPSIDIAEKGSTAVSAAMPKAQRQ